MLSAFPPQGSAKAEPPRELLLLPPGFPHCPISPFPALYLPVLPASSESKGGGIQLGLVFGRTMEVAAPGEGLGLLLRARERQTPLQGSALGGRTGR